MTVVEITRWDRAHAWTNWGGHEKKQLVGRLQSACPSMRLTERKRLAKEIVGGGLAKIVVENPKYAESLFHVLESIGAVVRIAEEEPNQSPEPTRMLGTSPAEQARVPSTRVAHL